MLFSFLDPQKSIVAHFSFSLSFSAAAAAAEAAERAARTSGSLSFEGGFADAAVVVVGGGRLRGADGIDKRCPILLMPLLLLLLLLVAVPVMSRGRGVVQSMACGRAGAAAKAIAIEGRGGKGKKVERRKKKRKKEAHLRSHLLSPPTHTLATLHRTSFFPLASFSPRPSPRYVRGPRQRPFSWVPGGQSLTSEHARRGD